MECLVSTSRGATEVRVGESEEGSSSGSKCVLMFDKKIEFHLARKPYTGFSTVNNGGDFRVETLNPDSGRKRFLGSDVPGKKVDTFDFLESGMDPELSLSISFRKIGAGLENLGNTCFLNSVLQCLTYTEPLVAYLQSGKHQNSCRVAGFCALCAIQKHVSCALQSTGRSLIPRDLVSNLRCISQNFRNARQEDAHEYMVNLLESMHKCCLPSGVPSESPAAYEKSLVHKIFGGRLRSQVQCQQCSYCSNTYDPFLDLSLEIVKADSLLVALRNFTAAEMLDGGEKQYQCQQCKQKVKAKKRLTVYKAPFVLAIHLKRFHPLDPCRKVDKKVSFDRSLDMKPFVSGPYEGDLKYSLYGVLVHSGPSTRSGHYVCYVRTSSGMWYLLNDNEVRQVSENTVLGQKAYMLFYVRDRKNVAQKRPCHVPQKDGNIANLAVKKFSKEHVENGSVGNVSRPDLSAENKKHDFGTAKTPLNETSLQQDHGLTVPKVDPLLQPSSSVPLPQDPSKVVSLPNQDLKAHLFCPGLPVNGNGGTTNLENSVNTTGTKTMDINKMSTCSVLQNCAVEKLATVENSPKLIQNIPVFNTVAPSEVQPAHSADKPIGRVPCLVLCGASVDDAVNEVNPVKLPTKSNCQNSQGSGICNETASGESLSNNSGTSGQEIVHELVKSSLPAVISNECLHSEASDIRSKKFKKKLLKKKIFKIHVGLKFRLPAVSLQKKKKHKKNKRCTSDIQTLIKEHLMDKTILLRDLGLSASNHSNILSSTTSHSRKGIESGLRKVDVLNCNGNSLEVAFDREFSDRDTQSGAVLATGEQVLSGISFSEPRELGGTNNGEVDASQCGMMSIVTSSQEEVTVARWDGIELAPPESMEPNVVENCRIGYVPDDWDEEYDRGKRKKLRQSQHEFGGPNLFQEIAAKKSSKNHQTKSRSFPRKGRHRAR